MRVIFAGKQLDEEKSIFYSYMNNKERNPDYLSIVQCVTEDEYVLHLGDKSYKLTDATMSYKLADFNIQKESTLHVVLRLRGGMFHETSGRQDLLKVHKPAATLWISKGKHMGELDISANTKLSDLKKKINYLFTGDSVPTDNK